MSLEIWIVISFFIGILGFAVFCAANEIFYKIYGRFHIEHDRRLKAERRCAELERQNESLRELYREKIA